MTPTRRWGQELFEISRVSSGRFGSAGIHILTDHSYPTREHPC